MSDPNVARPAGYPELLGELKAAVAEARWRALRVVITELLHLYWRIGRAILDRPDTEGWGTRIIDRLAVDRRTAFPEMKGLSRSNLFYMLSMASAWPPEAIVHSLLDDAVGSRDCAPRQAERPRRSRLVRRCRSRVRRTHRLASPHSGRCLTAYARGMSRRRRHR